ncbi:MEKHLA domain-containing protein [Sinobacterium caligoides]|uniref:MEKHLA domain-containing protein n=1 Tax=Sinobacterium caligoides TaxID=933926 RepID=A0A3N2E034_9GAMM|nr:MEKHLA domain-containing protein [Sinobacterium caligoides]ROS05466.1 MEKHLA domain-containing protein [Sinobacterium caligoides]
MLNTVHPPSLDNAFYRDHLLMLARCFQHYTGCLLCGVALTDEDCAEQLFRSKAVILSHAGGDDPIFNYANEQAMSLFELNWPSITQLPSRFSAEQPNRAERARLLAEVTANGFIENYQGVRIASSGRRFRIEQAVVWNVRDAAGNYVGQAATFEHWQFL